MAYCAWLSDALGLAIRLPTEWEWERAARGTDGREYPWGDGYRVGYANIDEKNSGAGPTYLQQTTAVGVYPQGASPEGVLDLSGNVWEWCLNESKDPERIQPGGTGSRVVRGGSWGGSRHHARAACRSGDGPLNRGGNLGLRVLCVSHIHLSPFGCRPVPPITVCGMRRRAAGWRGCVPSARRSRRRADL